MVVCCKLPHPRTAADVARHNRDGCFIDQQAALNGSETPSNRLVQQPCDAPVEILKFDGIRHPTEAFQGFANRTYVIEIDLNLDNAPIELRIAAQFEQQLVAVDPTPACVTNLDLNLISVDAVGAVVLARPGWSDANVANRNDFQCVLNNWKLINQAGLNDRACAATHHRQVHHQTKGFPIHKVGGGAVVGAREIFGLFDPRSSPDP